MEQLFELFYKTSGISTDTRNIQKDSLFIALKGQNFNGNHFATKAIEAGAKFAIVDEFEFVNGNNIFHVENCLIFLQKLANYHRKKFNIPVIGITGSNGKTTSKELINAVLKTTFNVLCTEGNLNNHIGVPLTLLQLNNFHQIAIIEMGANKPFDIQELCEITEPTHGIITNVGKAHLEGFKSFEGVVKTKSELYDSIISKNGCIIVNNDDTILIEIAKKSNIKIVTYGTNHSSDIYGILTNLNPFVEFKWTDYNYFSPILKTHLVGNYNFYNFLAAVTFGRLFNVNEEKINVALSNYIPSNNRSQIQKTKYNTLIVDCYNANPSSMMFALESFKDIEHPYKIAILGDMFELGDESFVEHEKVIQYCKDELIDFITIGKNFKEFNPNGYLTTNDFLTSVNLNKFSNSLILLKGSRGIALEKLIDKL